jgi:hypothetical protein
MFSLAKSASFDRLLIFDDDFRFSADYVQAFRGSPVFDSEE